MQGVAVKTCKVITTKDHDGRTNGKLIEVVSVSEPFLNHSQLIGQAYITICKPGKKKGLHTHRKKEDRFCVIKGQAEIYFNEQGNLEKLTLSAHDPKVIIIPPGVGHGIKCLGPTSCWVLNCPNTAYNKNEPNQQELNVEW